MVAMVEDMLKRGLIAQDEGRWALTTPLEEIAPGVPETLQRMLQVQFEQLSASEQQVLKTASVAGERFSVWAITSILEMETEHLEDLCEGLTERQQFIRSAGIHQLADGSSSAHYEFRHSLYREVLYRRLSEVSRSKLHRRLGERLEGLCTPCKPELASELALHFEEGHEYEQAIHYLILTAENAARRFAHQDSIRLLQHALKLVPKAPANSRIELEIQTLERTGDTHYALGAMVEAVRAYETEATRAAQAGLKEAQVNALSGLARAAAFIDGDRGVAVCEQAVQVSAGHDNPLLLARTQMLAASFRILYDGWRKEDAELCASANQTIRSFSGSGLPAYHEMMYSHVQSLQGDYHKALEKAEAAIPKTVGTDSLVVYLGGLSSKVFAFLHLGQLGEVLRLVLSGRAMAERNGNVPWLSIFCSLQGWLHTLAFDFEGELRLSKVVLGTNTEHLADAPRLLAMLFAGYAELALGESEEALRHFAAIRDRPVQPRFFLHWYWRMNAQLGLSKVWLESGKIVNARLEADGFLASALSTADPHLQALAWEMKTRVAMAEKDWAGAGKFIEQALAIVEQFGVPVAGWQVHATAWDLYRHVKDEEAAETHRARAEAIVLALANSFADDEPLRKLLLAAAPVRRNSRRCTRHEGDGGSLTPTQA